jgi:hypothetical protein
MKSGCVRLGYSRRASQRIMDNSNRRQRFIPIQSDAHRRDISFRSCGRNDRAGRNIFLVISLVQPETMGRYRSGCIFDGGMMRTCLLYTCLSLKIIKGFYGKKYPIYTNQK